MVRGSVVDYTAMDAEDRVLIPGNLPGQVTLAGLGEESAMTNRVYFFFLTIEANGAAFQCKELISTVLKSEIREDGGTSQKHEIGYCQTEDKLSCRMDQHVADDP